MGIHSRRLRGRRNRQDIDDLRARWELFFYVWNSLLSAWGKTLACGLATVQAVEVVLALFEGRTPHLLPVSLLDAVRDWYRGNGG